MTEKELRMKRRDRSDLFIKFLLIFGAVYFGLHILRFFAQV
jgi:hypothetical protein